MRFLWVYSNILFLDGDHIRVWSPPYARVVATICVHARHQEHENTHANLSKDKHP